jgi:hypothetical protein
LFSLAANVYNTVEIKPTIIGGFTPHSFAGNTALVALAIYILKNDNILERFDRPTNFESSKQI